MVDVMKGKKGQAPQEALNVTILGIVSLFAGAGALFWTCPFRFEATALVPTMTTYTHLPTNYTEQLRFMREQSIVNGTLSQWRRRRLRVFSSIEGKPWGRAFARIENALKDHKPAWVQWVDSLSGADVAIFHVLGKGQLVEAQSHPNAVVIQHVTHCDLSREQQLALWHNSLLAVSFHDLAAIVAAAEAEGLAGLPRGPYRLYSTPWGASTREFVPAWWPLDAKERYVLITGELAGDESHVEVLRAAAAANFTVKHTGLGNPLAEHCGPENDRRPECSAFQHLPFQEKSEFLDLLQHASYVPVLRRGEGFEMMGVEALLSGSRPVVYSSRLVSQPYRWYDHWAERVEEETPDRVEQQLTELFLSGRRQVLSQDELASAREFFDWAHIVPALYDRIWHELQRRRASQRGRRALKY